MSHDVQPEMPPIHVETPQNEEQWRPTSTLSRTEREEMQALSKEVFGNTSKWKKLIDVGAVQKVTKTVTDEVPQEDGTTKSVQQQVPVLNSHGAEHSVVRRYTVGELKGLMLELKAKIKEMNDTLAQQQLEAAQKKAEEAKLKEVQEAAGGSAI